MKKIYLLLLLFFTTSILMFAQIAGTTSLYEKNGKIGIGEIDPIYGKLSIKGTGPDEGIALWNNTGASTARIYVNSAEDVMHIVKGGNANNGLTINKDGWVGIRNTQPEARLEISGTGTLGTSSNFNSSNAIVKISNSDNNLHMIFDSNQIMGMNADMTIDAGVSTNSNDLILQYISTGNVGIGTNSPTHKLSVKGTIQAEEIIVETGWADYVFDDGYNLLSLAEVENHINKYGHLPNIPSEEKVKENGIGLGESNTLLLAKIEELTLYIIEQEKRITELERSLDD